MVRAKEPNCIESYIGDGYCDDDNNNDACQYDGGDCCNQSTIQWNMYCYECECLTATAESTTTSPEPSWNQQQRPVLNPLQPPQKPPLLHLNPPQPHLNPQQPLLYRQQPLQLKNHVQMDGLMGVKLVHMVHAIFLQ